MFLPWLRSFVRDRPFLKTVGVLSSAAAMGKVVAFGRELLVAALYGTSQGMDSFVLAQTVPVAIASIAGSAISTALLPVAGAALAERGDEGRRAANATSGVFIGGLLGVCVLLLLVFSRLIAATLGFGLSQGQVGHVQYLILVLAPLIWTSGMSAYFTAVCYSVDKFLVATMVPLYGNILLCAILVAFGRRGVEVYAVGTTVTSALQCLVLWIIAVRLQLLCKPRLDLATWKRLAKLAIPSAMVSSINQSGVFVVRALTSQLPVGSVSALRYAMLIVSQPMDLLIAPVLTGLYPRMSREGGAHDYSGLRASSKRALLPLLALLPVALVCIVFAPQIVGFLLHRGRFDAQGLIVTATVVRYYAIGIFFNGASTLGDYVLFATQQGSRTILLSVVSMAANLGLTWVLIPYLGVIGVPLAWSGALVVQTILVTLMHVQRDIWGFGPARRKGEEVGA